MSMVCRKSVIENKIYNPHTSSTTIHTQSRMALSICSRTLKYYGLSIRTIILLEMNFKLREFKQFENRRKCILKYNNIIFNTLNCVPRTLILILKGPITG